MLTITPRPIPKDLAPKSDTSGKRGILRKWDFLDTVMYLLRGKGISGPFIFLCSPSLMTQKQLCFSNIYQPDVLP